MTAFTRQHLDVDGKAYIVDWFNGGSVRIYTVTKRGLRTLTDRNNPALIARIMDVGQLHLERQSRTVQNTPETRQ